MFIAETPLACPAPFASGCLPVPPCDWPAERPMQQRFDLDLPALVAVRRDQLYSKPRIMVRELMQNARESIIAPFEQPVRHSTSRPSPPSPATPALAPRLLLPQAPGRDLGRAATLRRLPTLPRAAQVQPFCGRQPRQLSGAVAREAKPDPPGGTI